MSSIAQAAARFEIRAREQAPATDRLRLLRSGDGWSLVASDGRVVFEALGTRARRSCLEFARARGVLVVFS